MRTIWLGWDNVESLAIDFNKKSGEVNQEIIEELKNANILIAWYGKESYDGKSEVYFEKGGKLFKNYAYHCSCYGLEGQWDPEETTWEEIAKEKERETDKNHYSYHSDEDEKDYILRSMLRERGFDLTILNREKKFQSVS